MSSQSIQDIDSSNLERKVLKNTFLANSNNLSDKDRSISHQSVFSKTSRNFSPIHMQYLDSCMSKSSIFDITLLKSTVKEIILPFDLESYQNKLQDIVDNVLDGSILIIPSGKIMLSGLKIKKSLHFKGSPGSCLVLYENPIEVIEFNQENNVLVTFSEMNFCCEEILGQNALFYIENTQCEVRFSDCVFTYTDKTAKTHDNCCFVLAQPPDCESALYSSGVMLDSCSVSGFSSVCKACEYASIIVNKCHFTSCTGSALLLTSPKILKITQTVIEKSKKNAVEILAASEITGHSTARTKSSTSRSLSKEITLLSSDLKYNQGAGLLIHSENLADYNADLLIDQCKISNNKKEGICLKHILLKSLKITNSDISTNTLTGIWIQKTHRSSMNSDFFISYNRIFDSFRGYGAYFYSCCPIIENNEVFRNTLGGIFIAGSCGNSLFDVTKSLSVVSCHLQANGENGIQICEFSNNVILESCKISDNTKNGLFLLANPGRDQLEKTKNFIEAKHCEISGNCNFGIVSIKSRCFFTGVILVNNGTGPIQYGEDSQELVKFDTEANVSTSTILIPIKTKKSSCKGSCTLF